MIVYHHIVFAEICKKI